MSTRPDFDRHITAWLDEQAPMREPDDLFERVTADLAHTRRLPGWAILERWLPMQTTARFGTASRAAVVLALLAGLVAAFAAIGIASQPDPEPAPATGIARNGLIAFPSDGDIWVVEPDGSEPRALISTPGIDGPAVWSPDGTNVAFWSFAFEGDMDDQTAVDAAIGAGDMSVWVARADGSQPRSLIEHVKWASPCGTDLSWAHDGRRLAISHTMTGTEGPMVDPVITILSLDGEPPRRLVEDGMDPYWSPDDQTIAYHRHLQIISTEAGERSGVRLIGADGSNDRPLSLTNGSGCAFDGPAWSPSGAQLAFYGQGDGFHDIWVVNADGSGEVRISADPADEYWPRWSPDGSRIAFDRVVDGANNAPQFVVTDPDGSNQVMLDHPLVSARYPTWSPDGRSILGMILDEAHTEVVGLLLVDATGSGEPIELYRGAVDGDPSWQRLKP